MFPIAKAQVLAALHARQETDYLQSRENERVNFLAAYGPEILARLRGEALLYKIGGELGAVKGGLFYELEFGNTHSLGRIGGGSALKFELYPGADGDWKKRSPVANNPARCSLEEAIAKAEFLVHDVLLAALQQSTSLLADPTSRSAWQSFSQVWTDELSILERGWAHKYLSIVYPEIFTFHHSQQQLQGHFLRLGILPENNRWLLDWQWNQLYRLDPDFKPFPPALLGRAFYDAFQSDPVNYWRIGTHSGDTDCWPSMQQQGMIAIGWPKLGNLAEVLEGLQEKDARQKLAVALSELYEKEPNAAGNSAGQILRFAKAMKPKDRVVAMRGATVVGVGVITSDYQYHPENSIQPHQRKVAWMDGETPQFSQPVGLRTTLFQLSAKNFSECLQMETTFQPVAQAEVLPQPVQLSATEARMLAILERKGQLILYGPPGTGKTYHARKFAQDFLARQNFQTSWPALSTDQRTECEGEITYCTFHPAYGYEEFLEGYRPKLTASGQAAFEIEHGVFRRVCKAAQSRPERRHFLIIDEINRGNIPTILGECITLIESDKRGKLSVTLPYSKEIFTVPENVWLIGTMNTADRSISLLDTALRRRFGFVELMPEPERLGSIEDLPLSALLSVLNRKILQHVGRSARDLQIGHAYLMNVQTQEDLCRCLQDELVPLLKEYCYENAEALGDILGPDFLDAEGELCGATLADSERCFQGLRRIVRGQLADRLPDALEDGV